MAGTSTTAPGDHAEAEPQRMPSCSVVVPVYNSSSTLAELVERVARVLGLLVDEFEIVLVNDGSPDDSWPLIEKLSEADERVRGISLVRNFGQHNALLAGIREARYELIATLDDDLQNPPEELPKLFAELGTSHDVVYGTPSSSGYGVLRGVATSITKLALRPAMGAEAARSVSAFRLFRTSVRDGFADYQGPFVSIDVLLTWGTSRFSATPVSHTKRAVGGSNYTLRKLTTHALNMTTGFSTLPLQLASMIGFMFALFGVGVLIDVVLRRLLNGNPVPGFAFIASIVAIFSGAQLFALGIIGEYLARMYFRVMNKPPYTVRVRTDHIEKTL